MEDNEAAGSHFLWSGWGEAEFFLAALSTATLRRLCANLSVGGGNDAWEAEDWRALGKQALIDSLLCGVRVLDGHGGEGGVRLWWEEDIACLKEFMERECAHLQLEEEGLSGHHHSTRDEIEAGRPHRYRLRSRRPTNATSPEGEDEGDASEGDDEEKLKKRPSDAQEGTIATGSHDDRVRLMNLVHQRLKEHDVQRIVRLLDHALGVCLRSPAKRQEHDEVEEGADSDQASSSAIIMMHEQLERTLGDVSEWLRQQCRALGATEAQTRIITARRIVQRLAVTSGRTLSVLSKEELVGMCKELAIDTNGTKKDLVQRFLRRWRTLRYIHWNSDASSKSDQEECRVCQASRISVVLLPCRHAVCAACQATMSSTRRRTCAFCRRRVHLVWPGLEAECFS